MRPTDYWTSFGWTLVVILLASGCGGGGSGTPVPPARLAFVSSSSGNLDIYVVSLVQGYPIVNVTNHPAQDLHFSWSPSGSQLAFVSNRSGSEELWVVDSNGANATQLTSNGGSKHGTERDGCDARAERESCYESLHHTHPPFLGLPLSGVLQRRTATTLRQAERIVWTARESHAPAKLPYNTTLLLE